MAARSDGSVIIGVDGDAKGLENTLNSCSLKVKAALADVGKSAAVVTAAFTAAGVAAVNASTDFGAAFAKTQTIMDTAAVSVGDMREDILDLSATSGMAATDVSEAVYQAISGSVDTADAANFVSQANQLAVAGFTSLTNATDVLTTALNAYGLSADKVGGISNVLIQTQNLGKTSVDELASSMGRAISTGSAYGVNLENLSASYVELTRGGIATAEATTYLSSMLNELGDSGSDVGKVIREKTGKSFGQLMQDGESLGDVLNILLDSVNGNSEALMGLWGSQEAGKAANALVTQGLEDFNTVLGQMKAEMSGATTTTRDAYNTMTNTSEFVDTRFKNSLVNLGIAVGDQLTPALDKAKTAITGVLEGTADFVGEHPSIVAGLAGVTAATGALTVAIGGLTVAKKAKAAIDALNISLNANPAIFITSAVIGLGAALFTLASQAEDTLPSLGELTVASSALEEAVDGAKTACDDSIASVAGAADVAIGYVARLAELEAQGISTAEAQEEYRMTVEALNKVMPGLNLVIDEQTGLVQGGTEAIYAHIDALKEQAIAEAMQEKFREILKAQADAELELATNRAKRRMAQEAAEPIEDALLENSKQQQMVLEALNQVYADETLSVEEADEAIEKYISQLSALESEAGELSIALSGNEAEQTALTEAIKAGEEGLSAYEDEVNLAKATWNEYMLSIGDTSGQESQVTATAEQTAALTEYTQKLTDVQTALGEYEVSSAAAGLSVGSFAQLLVDSGVTADEAAAGIESYRDRVINATGEIEQKSMSDLETLISSMQQRTETYKSWNDNLAKLQVQYGNQLSDEFVAYIRSLGPEYNDVLAEWLNGNTESMTELQESVEEGSRTAVLCYKGEFEKLPSESERITQLNVQKTLDAINPLADGFGDIGKASGELLLSSMQEAVDDGLPELQSHMTDSGDDVGYSFAAGLTGGLRRGVSQVISAASELAAVPERITRQVTQTRSPSKVADNLGYCWPAGLAQGINRGTPLAEEAAQTQASVIVEVSEDILERARLQTEPVVPSPVYNETIVQPAAINSTAQLQAQIEVPVYLDGREIARSTARYVGEQMDFEVM